MNACIYDPYDQCYENCPDCPRYRPESDPDEMYEEMREREE